MSRIFIFIFSLISLKLNNIIGRDFNCRRTPTVFNGNRFLSCADVLIFEDDFLGDNLNLSKWKLERRFPTLPDYEFNMYMDDVFGVLRVNDGSVSITPQPLIVHFENISRNLRGEVDLGEQCTGRHATPECSVTAHNGVLPPFISAQFSTKDLFSFKYGRVDIRAKLPKPAWVFPQLWLQPVTNKYGSTGYHSGQIRIAFSRRNGNEIELYGGVILNATQPWRTTLMCRRNGTRSTSNYDDAFHVYTLIWTKDEISIAVDNEEYCTISAKDVALRDLYMQQPNYSLLGSGTNLAPFDQEFYITLGYGIGGHNDFEDSYEWRIPKPWKNTDPKANLKFWRNVKYRICQWLAFDDFKIDYVKVYSV